MRQLEFPENIQVIVGGKEYSLDNAVLKIWPESEETNGEWWRNNGRNKRIDYYG